MISARALSAMHNKIEAAVENPTTEQVAFFVFMLGRNGESDATVCLGRWLELIQCTEPGPDGVNNDLTSPHSRLFGSKACEIGSLIWFVAII